MTPGKCFGIVVMAAIAVALAVATTWTAGDTGAISERGQAFLPGLLEGANAITVVKVQEPDRMIEVKKNGDVFVDASGFPVNTDVVRNLIGSLALLRKEEKKTADKARYAELELADPDAKEGAGTLIELKDKDESEIVSVVAGEREFSVGGTGGGQYLRTTADGQSYLVRGFVKLPTVRRDWFDRTLFKTEVSSLMNGSLVDGAKTVYAVTRKNDQHELKDMPAGRVIDEPKLNRVVGMFETLRFEDVRAATKDGAAKGAVMKMETADGLEISVQGLKPQSEKGEWFRVTAKANKDSAKDGLKALEKKIKGFEFKLIPTEAEMFSWTIDDLTKNSES